MQKNVFYYQLIKYDPVGLQAILPILLQTISYYIGTMHIYFYNILDRAVILFIRGDKWQMFMESSYQISATCYDPLISIWMLSQIHIAVEQITSLAQIQTSKNQVHTCYDGRAFIQAFFFMLQLVDYINIFAEELNNSKV